MEAGAAVVQQSEAGVAAAAVVVAAAAAAESVAGAVVPSAAVGASDEEVLPCDWVEKVAGAWNCAKLWPQQVPKNKSQTINENSFRFCYISS